jgi:hypothetical protein
MGEAAMARLRSPPINVMELQAEQRAKTAAREAEIEAARVAAGDPRTNLQIAHVARTDAKIALDKAVSAASEAARLVEEAERRHQTLLEKQHASEAAAAAELASRIEAGEAVAPAATGPDMSAAIAAIEAELRLGKGALERLAVRQADAQKNYDIAIHRERTGAIALLVDIAINKSNRIREIFTGLEGDRAELAALMTEIKRVQGPIPEIVNGVVYGGIAKTDHTRDTFRGVYERLLEDPEVSL